MPRRERGDCKDPFSVPLWDVTLRMPDGDRRLLLRELRGQPGVVIRDVRERVVTVHVEARDEAQVRRDWASASVLSVLRVDGGWHGDWWSGEAREVRDSDYVLGPAGDGSDGDVLFAVPFHHFSVDSSGLRLTMFWNGYAFCEPGPVKVHERAEGVTVTVTERRPRDAVAAAGAGRRSTVTLRSPLGHRPVWDRRRGAVRPHA
jgi:hypothetical protein